MQASISLSPYLWRTRALPSLCIGRTWTHHRKCRVASDEGPLLRAFRPTYDDVTYATKSVLDVWQDAGTYIQQPEVGL